MKPQLTRYDREGMAIDRHRCVSDYRKDIEYIARSISANGKFKKANSRTSSVFSRVKWAGARLCNLFIRAVGVDSLIFPVVACPLFDSC